VAFKLVIETIFEFLHQWVKSSWLVSTILVKYILIGFLGYELFQRKDLESIKQDLQDHGDLFVGLIVLTGLILHLANLSPEPLVPVIGEVTALAFYAYLFWKY
jgi:hypothetical protein